MKLTTNQRETIVEAIRERCGGKLRVCAFCGHPNWTLVDGLVTSPLSADLETFELGGPMMPLAALVCTHCGNTLFFNVLALGLENVFRPTNSERRGLRREE